VRISPPVPQVDKIVTHIFSYVTSCNLSAMEAYWDNLDRRFFARLESAAQPSVRKLELCLRRYYIVYAVQAGRTDKVSVANAASFGFAMPPEPSTPEPCPQSQASRAMSAP